MTTYDFTVKSTDKETIEFGNGTEKIIIDVTFIPSNIGFEIKKIIGEANKEYPGAIPPSVLAEIIAKLCDGISAEHIVEITEYGTLDNIAAIIIKHIVGRRAEKNA